MGPKGPQKMAFSYCTPPRLLRHFEYLEDLPTPRQLSDDLRDILNGVIIGTKPNKKMTFQGPLPHIRFLRDFAKVLKQRQIACIFPLEN